MKTFICNNKTIRFSGLSGQIIDSSKHSETHMSSSGGGGYIGPNGGVITAPTVRSNIVTQHEFWLRSADGKEHAIKFTNVDIPMRTGQYVSLISATNEKSGVSSYVTLINHSAETQSAIRNADQLNAALQVECITFTTIGKGIGLILCAVIVQNVTILFTYVGFCVGAFLIFKKIVRVKKAIALFGEEIKCANKLGAEEGRARFHKEIS
jgi:hypothetical protein